VSSCFGPRDDRIHCGIDIAAAERTAIRAARAGRAVYSGFMPGYGNLLLIEHEDRWYTVYAHNQRHLVEPTGDGRAMVAAGQVVALVGRTGNATGPHVHFEIRKSIDSIDPLALLLARTVLAQKLP
jgi:murein DD-endopeptidase MepM/ murein hydrolase activator NlpD